jgi:hypothetical protein
VSALFYTAAFSGASLGRRRYVVTRQGVESRSQGWLGFVPIENSMPVASRLPSVAQYAQIVGDRDETVAIHHFNGCVPFIVHSVGTSRPEDRTCDGRH